MLKRRFEAFSGIGYESNLIENGLERLNVNPPFTKERVEELNKNDKKKQFLELINDKLKLGNVTLLYSAKEEIKNNAVVLKEWIESNL